MVDWKDDMIELVGTLGGCLAAILIAAVGIALIVGIPIWFIKFIIEL